MNLRSFLVLAAVGLASTTAAAEIVCDKCAYPPRNPPNAYWAGYLGSYWPGDFGTFNNLDLVQDYVSYGPSGDGTFVNFTEYWIFDLNDTADVTVTLTTHGLLDEFGEFDGEYSAELTRASVAECVQGAERITCDLEDDELGDWLAVDRTGKRLTLKAADLVPGRYAVRLSAWTSKRGSYTGRVSFTQP